MQVCLLSAAMLGALLLEMPVPIAGLGELWVGWSLIHSVKLILHPPVPPEHKQGLLKASIQRRAQMNIGNTGKVKHFSPFSFFDRDVAKVLLMSQALFSEAVSPPCLYSAFMLLSIFPIPSSKAGSCFLLPLSWLGTGGDRSLEWDTSSLSL